MNSSAEQQGGSYPTARKIRRACANELYRTVKRLGVYIPKEQIEKAEKHYFEKVALNLPWIHENYSNRKKLADWWDDHVSADIADILGVDRGKLCKAFRDAFGG
ncbi:dehydrogenase [Paenibacillus humicola]|uniref:dehydrogenase n=1 Tax=Paenibacillus humicola TaxID=3110540 RepID=UPI00237BA9F0|nr:dehydrogenase [Paenibacillus humicola]